jgi:hypothetical protein
MQLVFKRMLMRMYQSIRRLYCTASRVKGYRQVKRRLLSSWTWYGARCVTRCELPNTCTFGFAIAIAGNRISTSQLASESIGHGLALLFRTDDLEGFKVQ